MIRIIFFILIFFLAISCSRTPFFNEIPLREKSKTVLVIPTKLELSRNRNIEVNHTFVAENTISKKENEFKIQPNSHIDYAIFTHFSPGSYVLIERIETGIGHSRYDKRTVLRIQFTLEEGKVNILNHIFNFRERGLNGIESFSKKEAEKLISKLQKMKNSSQWEFKYLGRL